MFQKKTFLNFFPILTVILFCGASSLHARDGIEWTKIDDTWGKIEVVAGAPIPSGLADQNQAIESAKASALAIAETRLLLYILENQNGGASVSPVDEFGDDTKARVQKMVKNAKLAKTKWDDEICWVKLVLSKKEVKEFWGN